jgi:hypothetical protein
MEMGMPKKPPHVVVDRVVALFELRALIHDDLASGFDLLANSIQLLILRLDYFQQRID